MEILQKMKNNSLMNYSRRNNKLTNNVNNISNVQTCNGEINQIAKNSTISSKGLPLEEEYQTLTSRGVSTVLVSIRQAWSRISIVYLDCKKR